MIFYMLPFYLYFATGVITGLHVYTLLVLAAYGVPFNPLEPVSLLGSLCLLIAAYVSLFKPRVAARLALLASLTIWSFYGPAIAKFIRTNVDKRSSVVRNQTLPAAMVPGGTRAGQESAVEREGGFNSPPRFGANCEHPI
jgi:hypothetical protein